MDDTSSESELGAAMGITRVYRSFDRKTIFMFECEFHQGVTSVNINFADIYGEFRQCALMNSS